MNKRASAGGLGIAGAVVVALFAARGQAADRAPSATVAADPAMADITDVYAWMTGASLNLVMDVSPLDDGAHSFGPSVHYVFHLTSKTGLGVGTAGGTESRLILRFSSNTQVDAWLTDATGQVKAYVGGDPSTTGVASSDNKLRVFAGRRSDPRFFNASGFATALTNLSTANTGAGKDAAMCPALNAGQALSIRNSLTMGADAYAASNVMAIVVQLDKALVNTAGNATLAVWGSTHDGS